MILSSFPKIISDWWWNEATRNWPDFSKEKLLNTIRGEIVEQSDRFNKTRSFNSSSYGARDLSVLSYGNFFFARTWYAMTFALAEAFSYRNLGIPRKGPLRILDLGAGAGASGLASLSNLRKWGVENPISLEAWDYSGKSLATLKSLHQAGMELWPGTKITTVRKDLANDLPPMNSRLFDLVLLGFSLNEILQKEEEGSRIEWLRQVSQYLKPSGLLVITEPAGELTCMNLQSDSQKLTEENPKLHQHSPYFNGSPCPFLSQSSKYYSHEVRKVVPNEVIEKINGPLHLEIREVKFGLSILGRTAPLPQPKGYELCRIVSPVKKRKGTISFIGIGSDGIEYRYEFQRRDLNRDDTKEILAFERGDILDAAKGIIGKDETHIRLSSSQDLKPVFAPRLGKTS